MKIELIPTQCFPIGEERIKEWIKIMVRDKAWTTMHSGDTLVDRSIVEGEFYVYRRTQTYRVEKGTNNES